MDAEGDAVMMKFIICRAADTISRSRGSAMNSAMQFVPAQSVAHHQMEYTTPASATALRMIVATPATSRVKIRRGSNAMLLSLVPVGESVDLDHANRRAGEPFRYIRGSASSAPLPVALGGKPRAVEILHQP